MENKEEILPVVDECGNIRDAAPRSQCHDGKSMLLHPVVHLHVVNDRGQLLLQKRSESKKIQPGKWDTAVGGHVSLGESYAMALAREAAEEIGLSDVSAAKVIKQYEFKSAVERELISCNLIQCPADFVPQIIESDQIDALTFFSISDIEKLIADGATTPNFADEFRDIVKPALENRILPE